MATKAEWEARQHRLNLFTSQYLKGVGKIPEDGVYGQLTKKRIVHAKWWLGWSKSNRTDQWTDKLHFHLVYPNSLGKGANAVSKVTVKAGKRRRLKHNYWWVKSHMTTGVRTFDGVRVAAVAVPVLEWCRAHGWRGRLVSGYRDPAYSESLCYAMCGAPRCPGRCAGRSSNHSGKTRDRFAVDVSDYWTFKSVVARCPVLPHVYNHLPADPVHFSPNGY